MGRQMAPEQFANRSQLNFEAAFEMAVDCDHPAQVRNFHVSGRGAGVLRVDRSASVDLEITSLITNTIHFEGRLGGAPRPAPGGTSQLHVVGTNRLRLIWNLPNNQPISDLVFSRNGCSATPAMKLKPGMCEYSLFDGNGFYYCARPRVLRTSFRAF
jgi:hypothetical protein